MDEGKFYLDDTNFRHDYNKLPEEMITKAAWDELPEYSLSLPTGFTPGKTWKQNLYGSGMWCICRYGFDGSGKYVERHRPCFQANTKDLIAEGALDLSEIEVIEHAHEMVEEMLRTGNSDMLMQLEADLRAAIDPGNRRIKQLATIARSDEELRPLREHTAKIMADLDEQQKELDAEMRDFERKSRGQWTEPDD